MPGGGVITPYSSLPNLYSFYSSTSAYLALFGYLYTTWTHRIWPAIKVPEPETPQVYNGALSYFRKVLIKIVHHPSVVSVRY